MNFAIKKKINPNRDLEDRLNTLCNVSRFTYNFLLARSINNSGKPSLGKLYEYQKEFRKLVKDSTMFDKNGEIYSADFQEILKSAPSQIIENECKNVKKAWDTLKKRNKPSFKKAKESKPSFTIHKKTNSTFKYENQVLKVAKASTKRIQKTNY